jgi:hypothetical protein
MTGSTTLAAFGAAECPNGACSVDFLRRPVSEDEIRDVQGAWMLRGRRGMELGDESFWRARVLPLAARLGVEPGLILIAPMLARWA